MNISKQVNWTAPSGGAGERGVRNNVAISDNHETAFAVLYAALLGLSDEPCPATEMSNSWPDTEIESGPFVVNSSKMLGAATSLSSSGREYHSTGPHRYNEPVLGYIAPRYSGSSMDRLSFQGGAGQPDASASLGVDGRSAVSGIPKGKNANNLLSADSAGTSPIPSSSTEIFDRSRLTTWMDGHALSRSSHHCAMYCRLGMEAAGLNTGDRPKSGDAGDYGPFLLRHGAQTVPQDSYSPQVGDVAVFDKTDTHPHGHIEMYDGQHWVSDFMQHSFSPYRNSGDTPPFTIYRIT